MESLRTWDGRWTGWRDSGRDERQRWSSDWIRSRVSRGWDFRMERHFVAFEELIRMIDKGVLGGSVFGGWGELGGIFIYLFVRDGSIR